MIEVIQICQTDGQTITDCRQVPVEQLLGRNQPSLSEMMPVIIALGSLMAFAWVVKQIVRMSLH